MVKMMMMTTRSRGRRVTTTTIMRQEMSFLKMCTVLLFKSRMNERMLNVYLCGAIVSLSGLLRILESRLVRHLSMRTVCVVVLDGGGVGVGVNGWLTLWTESKK